MDSKKHNKVNLEKKKGVYSSIALLFAFAIVLVAFEYRTSSIIFEPDDQTVIVNLFEEDQSMNTFVKPPPPPPKKVIDLRFLIDEVIDEDPIEFASIEIDEEFKVETIVIPTLDEEVIVEEDVIVLIPDVMPEFPGGYDALRGYLSMNIKYPLMAQEVGIKGGVYLSFIVDKDGSISDIKVLSGIGGGCDDEAVRVVEGMPKWSPGKKRGKPVRVQFYLPINFRLQ